MNHAVTDMSSENAFGDPTLSKNEPASVPLSSRRLPVAFPIGGLMFLFGFGVSTLWNRPIQDAPIAVVNGEAIPYRQFTHRLEVAAGTNMLQQMITERLEAQMAAKQGVLPSVEMVEKKYQAQSASPGFANILQQTRQTPTDVKNVLRTTLISQALLGRDVNVTYEDAYRFYAANTDLRNPQARYCRPETVRIAAILSDKPDDIKTALHELASGTAFTQVAARYSKDQSRANGGLLPPVRRGSMNPQKFPGLETTLMGMKPGQQIDTFKAAGAMWIIRCVEHTNEEKVAYDKVKDECRQGALLEKGAQVNGKTLQSQLQEFRRDAKIDLPRPEYKDFSLR